MAGAEQELAEVVDYPNVRIFQNAQNFAKNPKEDLIGIAQNWAVADKSELEFLSIKKRNST